MRKAISLMLASVVVCWPAVAAAKTYTFNVPYDLKALLPSAAAFVDCAIFSGPAPSNVLAKGKSATIAPDAAGNAKGIAKVAVVLSDIEGGNPPVRYICDLYITKGSVSYRMSESGNQSPETSYKHATPFTPVVEGAIK